MSAEIDSYVFALQRRLFWMDGKKRKDIAMEVRSHLSERIRSGEAPEAAITSFGPVRSVAKDYLRIYGFGLAFIVLLMAAGAALAALTVPAIYLSSEDVTSVTWWSLVFLLSGLVLIIASSVKGGRNAGMLVGLSMCATRFVIVGLMVARGSIVVENGVVGSAGFVIASLLLPIVGYLASAAKARDEEEIEI